MVRALMRSIFGRNAGRGFCSIRTQRTPRLPRSMASVSPTGPAPTIRTSLSIAHRSQNRRSARRRQSGQLLERLIGRVGALSRRRIDELIDVGTEIDHDLFLMLVVAVEHHADDIVLAGADRLEHRRTDQRKADR